MARATILLLALWIGGLTSYAALVVPSATRLIGKTDQGFITEQVTNKFNLLALVPMLFVGYLLLGRTKQSIGKLGRLRIVFSIWIAVHLLLFATHYWMGQLLDKESLAVVDEASFYRRHQLYLWLTMLEMLAGWYILWHLTFFPSNDQDRLSTKVNN